MDEEGGGIAVTRRVGAELYSSAAAEVIQIDAQVFMPRDAERAVDGGGFVDRMGGSVDRTGGSVDRRPRAAENGEDDEEKIQHSIVEAKQLFKRRFAT